MTVEELIHKLEIITKDIESKDLIKDFSSILNGLEFILFDGKKAIDNLNSEDRRNNILNIIRLKVKFFAEIIKKYLELNTKDEYKYEIKDDYNEGEISRYLFEDDLVEFSTIGIAIDALSDTAIIKTIFHEFRHQRQNHFSKITDFKDLLNYPSNFIRIIKNKMMIHILEDINHYTNNHDRLYTEVDADLYGLYTPMKMITNIYELYPSKNEVYDEKVHKIQNYLIEEAFTVERKMKDEGKLNVLYKGEVMNPCEITSDIIYNQDEIDSLLFIDKCVKNNKDKMYPVLSLFESKNLIELCNDRETNIKKYGNKEKINKIYSFYIMSDPILILSSYIFNNDIEKIQIFIKEHPAFKYTYKRKILEMLILYGVDSPEIINLLIDKKEKQYKKENES